MLAFVVFLSFTGRPFGGRLVEVAVERTNRTRTRTRKRSIKDRARERRIHDTWEPSINSTHPCYFKQRHEAMLAFATRTHHTLLENVQILFLTPPLFFVFFFLLPRFPFFLPHHLQMNGINEEEFTNKKHVYVNFYVKIYYFRNSSNGVNVNRIANLIICSIDEIHISILKVSNDIIAFLICNLQQTKNDSIEIYKRVGDGWRKNVKLEISNFYHVNEKTTFRALSLQGR